MRAPEEALQLKKTNGHRTGGINNNYSSEKRVQQQQSLYTNAPCFHMRQASIMISPPIMGDFSCTRGVRYTHTQISRPWRHCQHLLRGTSCAARLARHIRNRLAYSRLRGGAGGGGGGGRGHERGGWGENGHNTDVATLSGRGTMNSSRPVAR